MVGTSLDGRTTTHWMPHGGIASRKVSTCCLGFQSWYLPEQPRNQQWSLTRPWFRWAFFAAALSQSCWLEAMQTFNTFQGKSSVRTPPCVGDCATARICYMRSGSVPIAQANCKTGFGSVQWGWNDDLRASGYIISCIFSHLKQRTIGHLSEFIDRWLDKGIIFAYWKQILRTNNSHRCQDKRSQEQYSANWNYRGFRNLNSAF